MTKWYIRVDIEYELKENSYLNYKSDVVIKALRDSAVGVTVINVRDTPILSELNDQFYSKTTVEVYRIPK